MKLNPTITTITGWGSYLPEKTVTNRELEQLVETQDEWIHARTGILARRLAAPNESTSDLAVKAGRLALQKASLSPQNLDLIIVATVTPDYHFPSTAALVQAKLGASRAAAFDLSAACSGFVYALAVADQALRTGLFSCALVIGADIFSRILNWKDRTTCILFGDGAGAVVLTRTSGQGEGIIGHYLGADGTGADLLYLPGGGSRYPASQATLAGNLHYLKMDGPEVFKFAVRTLTEATLKCLERHGFSLAELDYFIPHQANRRLIEAAAKKLGLPWEKVHLNVDRYANTSAASIPIALAEAAESGNLKPGNLVALGGFGAGLTWGITLLHWPHLSGDLKTTFC
ncbi:MAG: beta-ketoacyl-ACP synthase III [Bacillota bacterium]|nr:beta-ketoacyl-ACP synthase III [Bacillota bacterium]